MALNSKSFLLKKKSAVLYTFILLIAILFNKCKHAPDAIIIPDPGNEELTGEEGIPCDPDTIYFVNEILPLLQSSCGTSGCHDPATAEDGVILTNYADIIQTGKIKPYDPGDSEIYEKIMEDEPDERMPPPPKSPLTAEQKNMIYEWIRQGAKNNYCDELNCDTVNVTYSGTVWPIIQNNCTGCHSGSTPSGNIRLESYSNVRTMAASGDLMGVITHSQGFIPMPQNGNKLSECKIIQTQKWIDDGMPDN